jgi:hypothetical protein
MSIKIKDIGTKYILDWNVDKSFLSLSTFNLSTWNQTTEEYDTTLDSIKKIGSPDYGNMFDFSSGSTTIVSSSGVYYLLNCTTTSSSNNDEVHVKFYKNGTEIPCSLGSMVMSSGGKGNTIPFHCMTDMIDGDYIEVYVANMSGTTDITLENMNIILSELV